MHNHYCTEGIIHGTSDTELIVTIASNCMVESTPFRLDCSSSTYSSCNIDRVDVSYVLYLNTILILK